MTEKRCPACGETKPLDDFQRATGRAHGRGTYCKPCANEKSKAWKRANPEAAKESERRTNKRRDGQKREWAKQHSTKPCERCGAKLGENSRYRGYTYCVSCRHEIAHDRTARWLELRRRGLDNWQIAKQEGVSTHVVATVLSRPRVARFPDLEHVRAPYMNGQRSKNPQLRRSRKEVA